MSDWMVCWPAVRHPWIPDEDGDLEPDPRQDHDMWFGPFSTQQAASAFACNLRDTDDHRGYQVGVMYPPGSGIARLAQRNDKERPATRPV